VSATQSISSDTPLQPSISTPDPPQAQTTSPRESGWRADARRAQWSAAWQKLSISGLHHESETAMRVSDLLVLADVARLSGHPREAVFPLERIVSRCANDPRAALASFTLGTMRLDQLSEPSAGAKDIERALALEIPSALAEDAQARLVEAYARAGDVERARDAARVYRQRYPQGRRTRDIERWSSED